MSLLPSSVVRMLANLRERLTPDQAEERFGTKDGGAAYPAPLRPTRTVDARTLARYWDRLRAEGVAPDEVRSALADEAGVAGIGAYASNIESAIGIAKLPIGVVGPLRVNGLNAQGDYFVPLATTEAALVASYARGAHALTASGGVKAAVLYEGVLRSPAFVFSDVLQAGMFVEWVERHGDALREAAEATTRHGKLVSIEPMINDEIVFLVNRFTTGDASGQNMVTIATHAMCTFIEARCPIKARHWFIEGNFSGDKKASFLGLMTGRGRKVTASAILPDEVVRKVLRVEPEMLLEYAKVAQLGALISGQLGAQGHYANGLAALYIATGQDAACVSESSVGFTRMDRRDDGIFMSVTLPNVLVGSVGGGTGLPTQSAALKLMGLHGAGHGAALAEVVASVCLAGEVSIMAAIADGHFSEAHRKLARARPSAPGASSPMEGSL